MKYGAFIIGFAFCALFFDFKGEIHWGFKLAMTAIFFSYLSFIGYLKFIAYKKQRVSKKKMIRKLVEKNYGDQFIINVIEAVFGESAAKKERERMMEQAKARMHSEYIVRPGFPADR